jgi:hypothetical protein
MVPIVFGICACAGGLERLVLALVRVRENGQQTRNGGIEMIQFMKFKRKKAKMNTDLLKGFAARTQLGPDGKPFIQVSFVISAVKALDQQPILHTPDGRGVFGGQKEIAAKAGKLQLELLAMLMHIFQVDALRDYVKGTTTEDDHAARLDALGEALDSIIAGELPELGEG